MPDSSGMPTLEEKIHNFYMSFHENFEFTDKGAIKDQFKNRYLTPAQVYDEYKKWHERLPATRALILTREEFDKQLDIEKNEFLKKVNSVKLAEDTTPTRSIVAHKLQEAVDKKLFQVNTTMTQWETSNGNEIFRVATKEDFLNYILADKSTDELLKKRDAGEVKRALDDIIRQAGNDALKGISDSIAFDPKHEGYCDSWIHEMYKYFGIQQDENQFRMMLKHWAWQVKRRILNRSTKWEIVLNFYGPTGSGKTVAIEKLLKPLEDFSCTTQIGNLLGSEKEVKKYSELYVIFLDELAVQKTKVIGEEGLTKDDVNRLKQLITGKSDTVRIYGTQDQAKRRITASLIAAANNHIYDVIWDDQTMRRYYEFTCKPTTKQRTKEDYAEANKWLDRAVEFWKGVDESLEDGYWDPDTELGKKVWLEQADYYPTKSTVMSWASQFNLTKNPSATQSSLYASYSGWCREFGYKKTRAMLSFVEEVSRRWPDLKGPDGLLHASATPKDIAPAPEPPPIPKRD
jgi:hypothetical protein